MARLNRATATAPRYTQEGAVAAHINPAQELRRSVMACLLWEDSFYESGASIADRLTALVPKVNAQIVAELAVEARTAMKLRHVPLLLVREMARLKTHRHLVADTLAQVIQRPDELTEFLAIYWKDKRQPLSAQVKKGLAQAFRDFSGYQLAKYDRDAAIKLRDVLFLCHAKPKSAEQAVAWKSLIDGTLEVPDTWEVALSAGADKKATFERLIRDERLGALALLRNLRNMVEAGVDDSIIREALRNIRTERVLPFRFISAARYAPRFEPELEKAMFYCLEDHTRLPGHTLLLVDVSGSMEATVSGKSEISRLDAACGLAMLLREVSDRLSVVSFSTQAVEVPPRRGFALADAIKRSQPHSSTMLGQAVTAAITHNPDANRIIVITDEQSHDRVPQVTGNAYMVNVASYQNGVGYGQWTQIDGWSEAIVDYIREFERAEAR